MQDLAQAQPGPAGRRLWLFRPGKSAAVEALLMTQDLYCPDFGIVEDMSDHIDRDMIAREVEIAHPGETATRHEALVTQLDQLLNQVMAGDLVLCPLPRDKTVSIGMVEPGSVRSPEGRPGRRIRWLAERIARTAFLPDLLHSMGAHQLVCRITRNDALRRVEGLISTGRDPGPDAAGNADLVSAPAELIGHMMLARIATRIGSTFAGHGLADLVAAVLETEGYRTRLSPPGPDGGVDILAGKGLTGLEGARLTVQVKSGSIVADHPTWQQLAGAMSQNGSDAGLLVSWGGVTRQVRQEAQLSWFRVRIWDARDLTEAVLSCYDQLPLAVRDQLQLKRMWIC